jgi:uracil-DNA glycosylase family 4
LKAPVREKKVSLPKEEFSEKVQVIESLERFAQEKATEIQSNVIKIDGGEVVLKSEPGWDDLKHFNSLEALRSGLGLDPKFLDIVFNNKKPGEVTVLFVSEKFRNWEEAEAELKTGFINELIVGFPLKTAELFERMIMAMKLTPNEVIVFPVEGNDESDYSRDVMEVAAFYRPEIIITLGAKATQKILKSNDRLTMVHGQFFNRRMGEIANFQVVPLFHPSIIETNQNMKKTAWADMQKIMKHLKKLP